MITENEVRNKIREYISEQVFSDPDHINHETLLFQEGYFDSMGFITLITFIEDEFNITTDDTDFVEENFESINAISDFVTRKLTLKTDPKPA